MLLLPALLIAAAHAAVVEYRFSIGEKLDSIDGFTKRVVYVNDMFPGPTIRSKVGDTVHVHVVNNLHSETTSIHFHGIMQLGTPFSDGVPFMTQCGIAPGDSFTYSFVTDAAGTYMYHSHTSMQVSDGLVGALIVEDPAETAALGNPTELVMLLTDLHHNSSDFLAAGLMQYGVGFVVAPAAAALINGQIQALLPVNAGDLVRLRLINMAMSGLYVISVENHALTLIESSAERVVDTPIAAVEINAGQRASVLFTANQAVDTYWISFRTTGSGTGGVLQGSAVLQYNGVPAVAPSRSLPTPPAAVFYEGNLRSLSASFSLGEPTMTIYVNTSIGPTANGANKWLLNGVSWERPAAPLALLARLGRLHEAGVPFYDIPQDAIVRLIIDNTVAGPHPWHIHSFKPWIVGRGTSPWTSASSSTVSGLVRADTFHVRPNEWVDLRFTANNAGAWLVHCHNNFHHHAGMAFNIVVGKEQLQASTAPLPDGFRPCGVVAELIEATPEECDPCLGTTVNFNF
eukprot:TRINITY_DN1773_c0_g1_i1.p1 TRINITY_DN1773_c0_g1~~TRINITY_DN1773_c0_g1_i1.p1  ORF type:complete len:526 (+),score=120.81 TRINITY_DN1773_c0_g1_i1:34-1578(+)